MTSSSLRVSKKFSFRPTLHSINKNYPSQISLCFVSNGCYRLTRREIFLQASGDSWKPDSDEDLKAKARFLEMLTKIEAKTKDYPPTLYHKSRDIFFFIRYSLVADKR
jgi:hypothetical protein